MSLKIRLARGGAKKRPYYSVVVADSAARPAMAASSRRSAPMTRCSTRTTRKRWTVDLEGSQAWMGKGAQPTDRVLRHFADRAC